jgi:pyridoxal phosphate enzyme (YggS family)
MIDKKKFEVLTQTLEEQKVTLVAVSKFQSIEKIEALYAMGQRHFGENYVQELLTKYEYFKDRAAFSDIKWHFIGHLQTNKVKYIAPFVYMIHSVDRFKLLQEIQKEAAKHDTIIACLLQIHIAEETTKFGMTAIEAVEFMEYCTAQKSMLNHIELQGVMGMASFSDDEQQVKSEFATLKNIYNHLKSSYFLLDNTFKHLSMGMSSDYLWAIEEGSTMVRIGSTLFGARN